MCQHRGLGNHNGSSSKIRRRYVLWMFPAPLTRAKRLVIPVLSPGAALECSCSDPVLLLWMSRRSGGLFSGGTTSAMCLLEASPALWASMEGDGDSTPASSSPTTAQSKMAWGAFVGSLLGSGVAQLAKPALLIAENRTAGKLERSMLCPWTSQGFPRAVHCLLRDHCLAQNQLAAWLDVCSVTVVFVGVMPVVLTDTELSCGAESS